MTSANNPAPHTPALSPMKHDVFRGIAASFWFISLVLGIGATTPPPDSTEQSAPLPAGADSIMTYIYNAPESQLDVRYQYHWRILQTALDKTVKKYGPYRMQASEPMTEKRQTFEMRNRTGNLSVMYLSTTPDLERDLIPIHIPVDKNLGGYCILLIRKGEQHRFDSVRSLTDMKKFSYGLGLGWIDVDILKSSKLRVVTGSSYDGLFEMLVNKRFDTFLRGTVEILDEYKQRKDALPDLAIEQNLLLYYTLPMYFWFPKTYVGRRLAARAEEGMWIMINDGTYDAIFDTYQRHKIEELRLKDRKIFSIKNPFVNEKILLHDKRLWFNPATYKSTQH